MIKTENSRGHYLNPNVLFISSLIIMAAMSRLIPHPYNFAPISALALFSVSHFKQKSLAFIIPMAAMTLSNLFIGFSVGTIIVYATFLLIAFLGLFYLRYRVGTFRIAVSSIAASCIFYVITNFGAWLYLPQLYARTFEGLIQAYVAGIPFFWNTLAGDASYCMILFGIYHVVVHRLQLFRPYYSENYVVNRGSHD